MDQDIQHPWPDSTYDLSVPPKFSDNSPSLGLFCDGLEEQNN